MKILFGLLSLSIIAYLIFTGCNGDKQADKLEPQRVNHPTPSGEDIRALPANWMELESSMIHKGVEVELQAYFWRDFMPGPDYAPEEQALNGVITLQAQDTVIIEGRLNIRYVWLVHGDEYWGQSLRAQQSRPGPDYEVKYAISAGPRWDVGEPVDVIVRVDDLRDTPHFLRLGMQVIQATH